MTKANFTSINVVLDRSGSMETVRVDTIGSFNSFIKDQKKVPGEVMFSLVAFNNHHEVIHDCVPLASVNDLTLESYVPRSTTALLDTIGWTINNVGAKLSAMKEEDRPSQVLFVVLTDGEENSSHEFNKDTITSMIKHQREHYSWEFVFLGVDENSIKDAKSYGFVHTQSYDHSGSGVKCMMNKLSSNVASYRSCGESLSNDFFQQKDVVDDKSSGDLDKKS